MRRVLAATAALLLVATVARGQGKVREAGAGEFSFYGLRFGMTRAEVRQVMPTNEAVTEVLEPRHGMSFLQLGFDYRDRLQEIRASYRRPAAPLQQEALRRALRERFLQPIGARWRGVAANLDEHSNQAALTLVLLSLEQREEEIEHYKDDFLRDLE